MLYYLENGMKKMKKIALGVEYDGTFYHGWQFQKIACSVQEELEKALSIVADHKISIICAGRTDSGVHSFGQVIHFNTTSIRTSTSWTIGVNSYLSKYISIVWMKEVLPVFHARYSALSRSYRYIIYNYCVRTPIFHNRAHHIYKRLNAKKMHAAAQYLLGEHDFASFRATNCQSRSSWRKILKLNVKRTRNWIIIDITANSFLYHMVRNIVGTLIEVGNLKKKDIWMQELLFKKNRSDAGVTAPAKGLYLMHVEYPLKFGLPKVARRPDFII
jgi:tRNA pseudouridine38-40 synthase